MAVHEELNEQVPNRDFSAVVDSTRRPSTRRMFERMTMNNDTIVVERRVDVGAITLNPPEGSGPDDRAGSTRRG
jgi:hypothetical protein